MSELVLRCDLLHQISSDAAHQIVEVVLRVAFSRQPEGDVIVEWWVFTESLRHTQKYNQGANSRAKYSVVHISLLQLMHHEDLV